MKYLYLLVTLLTLAACGNHIDQSNLQEGDIVFIAGQSSQAPYIKIGTMSRWSHCGIVVNTPDGLKVLEASKTVRLVSVERFIGFAKDGNWCAKRPDQTIDRPIRYRKYLGMPYDLQFKFDNGKMYCSELVWLIYKDNGIELCKPRKVSSYMMTRVPKVNKLLKQRGISADQETVAPSDLYRNI